MLEYYKTYNIKGVKSPPYHRLYENVSKLKFFSPIIFKIGILDKMLSPKTVFHLKGYTTDMGLNP